MARIHLFGHMDRNLVKKGDKVIKRVTPIGTIGTGNGQYYAHLHFSISEGLSTDDLYKYISGWSKSNVEKYYREPNDIDFEKMFGFKVDVGNFGYGWLDWVGYGYHPGVDVNGLGGGNTDFRYPFKSSCDGTVIYEWRGWTKNGGWGNLIMIEEEEVIEPTPSPMPDPSRYNLASELDKEAKNSFWMGKDFDDTNPDHHRYLADKMKEIRKGQ